MAIQRASSLSGANQQLARREILTVALLDTKSISEAIDCRGGWIGFLHLGAALDGADIRFLVTEDGDVSSPT
ncbi:MAG: hypothetical protein IH820_08160, partial [Bacteroidetes bacterium]|nr:hypothetical protein [Bacteroidota bacterium]